MSTIIKVTGLKKFYKIGHETVKALRDINLEIEKGEICCILGTSGSGKSTLLNQLAGLEKPTAGTVYIGKTNISRLSENQLASFRQKNIGFVFQSYNLLPSMSAMENVAMPLMFKGTPKEVREREAKNMLIKVGLGTRLNHRPSEMSGGQQQRVGIARAFVAKPKIVFADEPTGNLDSKTTIEVMELLIDMAHKNGITFVLVTHDNELANYADRIVTIKDGMVLSDRINENPVYKTEKPTLGDIKLIAQEKPDAGDTTIPKEMPKKDKKPDEAEKDIFKDAKKAFSLKYEKIKKSCKDIRKEK